MKVAFEARLKSRDGGSAEGAPRELLYFLKRDLGNYESAFPVVMRNMGAEFKQIKLVI